MSYDLKQSLILTEGTPVEIMDHTGTILFKTKAIIGKVSSTTMSEINFEYSRKGLIIPNLDIRNGLILRKTVTGETFIIVAVFDEVINNTKQSTSIRLIQTNSWASIKGFTEIADDYGNIISDEVTKATKLPVHVSVANARLMQFKPGLKEIVEYRIYAPHCEAEILDRVGLMINGGELNFKVESVDLLTFPGLVLLDVRTETR